ncbi:MAG: hypothetical protein QJR13_03800 [Bacillota bacterium]|nr:hypothetical protein [Bacillota bacterium]
MKGCPWGKVLAGSSLALVLACGGLAPATAQATAEPEGAGAARPPVVLLEIHHQGTVVLLEQTPLASLATAKLGDAGEGSLLLKLQGEAGGFGYTATAAARTADRERPYGRVELPEATLAWRWGAAVLEAGKQTLSWGKGFIARPSFPLREKTSYLTVSLDLPLFQEVASTGIAWADWGDTAPLLWGRVSWLFAASDLDLGLAGGPGRRPVPAAAYSTDLGRGWEWHAELSLPQGSDRLYPTGDLQTPLAPRKAEENQLYPRGLVGVEYLSPSGVMTVLEFYHQADGYNGAEADQFWQLSRAPWGVGPVLNQLQTGGFLRQNYAALAVTQAGGGNWWWQGSHLANLDDGSGVSRFQLTYLGQKDLEPGLDLSYYGGKPESEFGALARWEIATRLTLYF